MFSDGIYAGEKRGAGVADVAKLAAGMLSGEHRIASFSVNGWDTHIGQDKTFKRPVAELCAAILTLKAGLAPDVWRKTAILAITEFGRTARENGSGGTDHGTGGLAIIAGGAVAGGRVHGVWPTLEGGQPARRRDLAPTTDLRQLAAAMLYQQFGIPARDLGGRIFPGLTLDTGRKLPARLTAKPCPLLPALPGDGVCSAGYSAGTRVGWPSLSSATMTKVAAVTLSSSPVR